MQRYPLVASFALTLLINACNQPKLRASTDADPVIYVIGRNWHTDIGLPVQELSAPLATLQEAFPGAQVLTFGFGEREFLVNRKNTFGAMLNALLPSQSALLMTALQSSPAAAFGQTHVVVLRVSRADLERIEAGIWAELVPSSAGNPALLAEGPYAGSVFYAARSTYDGFFTCNTWTAAMMRTGGLAMPAGLLFADQVMTMARWYASDQTR